MGMFTRRPGGSGARPDGPRRPRVSVQAILVAAAGVLGFLVSPYASAQQIPPSADPGRIEDRLRPAPPPLSKPDLRLPELRARPAPEDAERVRFRLAGVLVTGATVYGADAFRSLYEEFFDTEVSLATVYEIAQRITVMYRNDGYILSQAVVPAQRVVEGIVTIQVVEGFIDRIDIQNDDHTNIERVRAYAEKIRQSRPLNRNVLERYLLLANDLPGIGVRTILTPSSETPGAADLTLVVSRDQLQASATVDNRGTRLVGPFQAIASAGLNSVLGEDERISLVHVATPTDRELRYYNGQVQWPVGNEGTTVQASASLTRSRPGFTLRSLEVRGTSKSFRVGVNHPFIRSRAENLTGSARFEAQNSRTDIYGNQLLTEDRIRVLRVEGRYDRVDAWRGLSTVSATVSRGVDAFGARETGSSNLSRAAGVSDFTKVNLDLSRLQHFGNGFSVLGTASAQKSANALLASEEFGVGGAAFGSAYDPSEITGDDGLAARIELRYSDTASWPPSASYQLYTFYDIGKVWNRDAGAGEPSSESLASAGLGTRFAVTAWLSGNFEVAKPLTRKVDARGEDGKDLRLFFGMTARF
jgi:hemolysin activation/secretion protein